MSHRSSILLSISSDITLADANENKNLKFSDDDGWVTVYSKKNKKKSKSLNISKCISNQVEDSKIAVTKVAVTKVKEAKINEAKVKEIKAIQITDIDSKLKLTNPKAPKKTIYYKTSDYKPIYSSNVVPPKSELSTKNIIFQCADSLANIPLAVDVKIPVNIQAAAAAENSNSCKHTNAVKERNPINRIDEWTIVYSRKEKKRLQKT